MPPDIFDTFTELEELSLRDNDLKSLPSGIFDNLTKLRILGLATTGLRELPDDIFDKNTELRELYLSENRLRDLPSGLFDENSALKQIFLSENPLRIADDTFDPIPGLQHLLLPNALDVAPILRTAELSDETTIELTYHLPLDRRSAGVSQFIAKVNGVERTITGTSTLGRVVSVTLGSAVAAGDTVTLTYLNQTGAHLISRLTWWWPGGWTPPAKTAESFTDTSIANDLTN